MNVRNAAVAVLTAVTVIGIALAVEVPGWENARLIALAAFAVVAMDVLARGPFDLP